MSKWVKVRYRGLYIPLRKDVILGIETEIGEKIESEYTWSDFGYSVVAPPLTGNEPT